MQKVVVLSITYFNICYGWIVSEILAASILPSNWRITWLLQNLQDFFANNCVQIYERIGLHCGGDLH